MRSVACKCAYAIYERHDALRRMKSRSKKGAVLAAHAGGRLGG